MMFFPLSTTSKITDFNVIALLRSDLVTPMARCSMHYFVDVDVAKLWN